MIERYSLPQMSHIWTEENKFRNMLAIELLVCEAQAKQGLIPASALARIKRKASFSVTQIKKIEEKTQHDIVAFVSNVGQTIGPDAKYLHMGLTSSDLLDTTLALQLKQAADILIDDTKQLLAALARQAKKYKDTVCMGRTHGIHAEPTTFGLKVALWYDASKRNLDRLEQARKAIAVGKISGAVGTYSNIDPSVEQYVCRKLGLIPAKISTQIIQRDAHAQYLTTLAVCGASLEQIATEIRHLQKTEVLEVEEPFGKGQKGSSAMPHKRNPVICERICGLSRILRGNAITALENVALWHERDISHSSAERVILPDSTLALDYMLRKMIYVIDGMQVYPEHMMANLLKTKGLIFSQRVLLALMEKGLSRTVAYDLVQCAAMDTWKRGIDFRTSLLMDREVVKHLNFQALDALFDLNYYVRHVPKIFKRVGLK